MFVGFDGGRIVLQVADESDDFDEAFCEGIGGGNVGSAAFDFLNVEVKVEEEVVGDGAGGEVDDPRWWATTGQPPNPSPFFPPLKTGGNTSS